MAQVPSPCDVVSIYDLNAILVCAMPCKNDGAMNAAFKQPLTPVGMHPRSSSWTMNAPRLLKPTSETTTWTSTLPPPHNHRVNAAEQAIATFKEHFISALATVDKVYPLQLWDKFLPLTLSLL